MLILSVLDGKSSWSSWFEPNVQKNLVFEPKNGNVEQTIKFHIVKMRMFDIHKDIWSLGFLFNL